LLPGSALCLVGAGVSVLLNRAWSAVSALLIAILLGALLGNLVKEPDPILPGRKFTEKHLVRAGIALLGLQV